MMAPTPAPLQDPCPLSVLDRFPFVAPQAGSGRARCVSARSVGSKRMFIVIHSKPAPPNYPLRDPEYHLIETIRPLIELHGGVLEIVGHHVSRMAN